jgi:carbonic anhydrase/acetyltransferase-like protein (isoleucine patch superfamily)
MTRQIVFRPELVHPTVFVAAGAQILGDVTIEEHASVWFNAVVRGESSAIRIGARTNVQDGCVLHADPGFPCILGQGVTLGHSAIVHGATVEENVVIGMRAVVMNGARIGANSIVGVGAVVTAGTLIPPGSLVLGLPAKVRRALTHEEVVGNRRTSDHYVEEAKAFLDGSKTSW